MSYEIEPNTVEYLELQQKLPKRIKNAILADGIRRINKRYIKAYFPQFDANGKIIIVDGDSVAVKNKRIRIQR